MAERLAGYLGCHARSIAETGFSSFTGGWLGPTLLGGFLAIYVALIGYRLILGLPFGPRDVLLAAARAGAVMALATSWPAYDTTVYRLVFDGPGEVASAVLPGDLSVSTLEETAQRLDKDLLALHGQEPEASAATGAVNGVVDPQAGQAPVATSDQPEPIKSSAAIMLANVTVGTLGAVRVAGGLLLACGPLFLMLALFDQTLGLFEGWVRGLLIAFVASAGAAVVTALELGFIETSLIASNPLQAPPPSSELEPTLLALATLFASAMLAVLIGSFVVGAAFRLPRGRQVTREIQSADRQTFRAAAPAWEGRAPASRAEVVVDAVRRLSQWETRQSTIDRTSQTATQVSTRLLQRRSAGTVAPREAQSPHRRTSPAQTSLLQRRDKQP